MKSILVLIVFSIEITMWLITLLIMLISKKLALKFFIKMITILPDKEWYNKYKGNKIMTTNELIEYINSQRNWDDVNKYTVEGLECAQFTLNVGKPVTT